MSVSLSSNFFLNARGITFEDGGGFTWVFNKNTNQISAVGTSGSVLSSVGLTDSSTAPIYTIGNSPLLANGAITLTLNAQAKNLAFLGPVSGANAQPAFRALVSADLPATAVSAGSYTYASLTVNAQGQVTAASSGTQPVTSIGSSNLSIGGTAAVPTVNLSSTQVTNIGLGGTALQSVTATDSIAGSGTAGSPLELAGDSASPGNSFYYGTNGSGTKGWYASTAVPAAANPGATFGVNLAGANGSATTFLRSDVVLKLDQSISPTWSGAHTFSSAITVNGGGSSVKGGLTVTAPASGNALTVNGLAGAYAAEIIAGSTAGSAYGLVILAGTSSSDNAFVVQNRAGTTNYVQVRGDGPVFLSDALTVNSGGIAVTGASTFSAGVGFNGAAAPAQVTGFGTPTGASVVASFSGTAATTAQMQATIAQILTVLKAAGLIGN